ncbi:MAG: hypothetical protein HQL23_07470, partial [Candidatus Omnitrophica bacterium]|nr:hypothetical protein [Candidatus Omnitrophota bacterium]
MVPIRRMILSFGAVFFLFNAVLLSADEAQPVILKDAEQVDFANGLFERSLYSMAAAEYQKFIRA